MYTFPQLIRKIRNEADLTQVEFAKLLDVSPVLIAMIETGQKEVSKKLIIRLAEVLRVHPASITPFLFITEDNSKDSFNLERAFTNWGQKMQTLLINKRSKTLKKYVGQEQVS